MSDEVAPVYCVCKSAKSDDAMIACDNPEGCEIEWFHYECVGITTDTVPTGDWFCSACPQKMENRTIAMAFVCEYCEKEFSDKRECIEHKKEHQVKRSAAGKHRKSQSKKQRQSNQAATSALTSSHATSARESSPISNIVSDWDMPRLQRQDQSHREASVDKIPQSLSPKTGDLPTMNDPPASHSGAEMGDIGPQADDRAPQFSDDVIEELAQFSDEQILAELTARQEAYICVCGTVFRDQSLYYLHRSTHNTNNPKKCSSCDYTANDWYDFMSHFFVHRKGSSDTA